MEPCAPSIANSSMSYCPTLPYVQTCRTNWRVASRRSSSSTYCIHKWPAIRCTIWSARITLASKRRESNSERKYASGVLERTAEDAGIGRIELAQSLQGFCCLGRSADRGLRVGRAGTPWTSGWLAQLLREPSLRGRRSLSSKSGGAHLGEVVASRACAAAEGVHLVHLVPCE